MDDQNALRGGVTISPVALVGIFRDAAKVENVQAESTRLTEFMNMVRGSDSKSIAAALKGDNKAKGEVSPFVALATKPVAEGGLGMAKLTAQARLSEMRTIVAAYRNGFQPNMNLGWHPAVEAARAVTKDVREVNKVKALDTAQGAFIAAELRNLKNPDGTWKEGVTVQQRADAQDAAQAKYDAAQKTQAYATAVDRLWDTFKYDGCKIIAGLLTAAIGRFEASQQQPPGVQSSPQAAAVPAAPTPQAQAAVTRAA